MGAVVEFQKAEFYFFFHLSGARKSARASDSNYLTTPPSTPNPWIVKKDNNNNNITVVRKRVALDHLPLTVSEANRLGGNKKKGHSKIAQSGVRAKIEFHLRTF